MLMCCFLTGATRPNSIPSEQIFKSQIQLMDMEIMVMMVIIIMRRKIKMRRIGRPIMVIEIYNLHDDITPIHAHARKQLRIPLAGSVALTKTHHKPIYFGFTNHWQNTTTITSTTTSVNNDATASSSSVQKDPDNDVTLPTHIIRLVRNPGDQLIRNLARWKSKERHNNVNTKKFFEDARKNNICKHMSRKGDAAEKWVKFHKSWEEASLHVPTVVLFYEHLTATEGTSTSVDATMKARQKMAEVIRFVGEEVRYNVNYTEVIRTPTYQHGSLMRDLCGIKSARRLHEVTKSVTDSLGYTFDWDEGVWHTPP